MRLIDADALIEQKFKNPISYNAFVNLAKRQPTVDPYKHGQWIDVHYESGGVQGLARFCSICKSNISLMTRGLTKPNYCPCCGAKMDEVEE